MGSTCMRTGVRLSKRAGRINRDGEGTARKSGRPGPGPIVRRGPISGGRRVSVVLWRSDLPAKLLVAAPPLLLLETALVGCPGRSGRLALLSGLERFPDEGREAFHRLFPVAVLAAVGVDRDLEDPAAVDAMVEARADEVPTTVGERGRVQNVPAQLHAAGGGIGVLTPGPAGARGLELELGAGDGESSVDPYVCHGGSVGRRFA